jgi:chemotaxis protein methyltransferase CheR
MVEVITTNKTGFFREIEHFDYLRKRVLPELKKRRVRLWSAGCSSGEEPYSLAILLREELPAIERMDVRILATDISQSMLEKARLAVYEKESLGSMPTMLVQKYFDCFRNGSAYHYRVKDHARSMVQHGRLNLVEAWPLKGPFSVILCRNVMIYFERSTQQSLVNRFWDLLEPGGHLFVGHSESLSMITHKFNYVKPAIYQKGLKH